MNRLSRYRFVFLVLTICVLSGCSNDKSGADAVVQGTVTIDGVLANRGQVTFFPAKQGPVATGPIHEDGSFSLRVGQGNMANPDESKIASGKYIATVVVNEPADKSATVGEGGPPLAGKRLTAIKYSQKESSGLNFTVKPGRNVFPIELEGSQNDPAPELPIQEEEAGEVKVDEEHGAERQSEGATQEANSAVGDQEQPSDPAGEKPKQ
jgi:hypothetical protein